MTRRVFSLTETQVNNLLFALGLQAEDGVASKYLMDVLRRQAEGKYHPAERTSIYETALRMAKRNEDGSDES